MQTPWDAFREALEGRWMYLKLPGRKTCDYVKFEGDSQFLESNIIVLKINHNFTVGKNKLDPAEVSARRWAQSNLSYYKLFSFCEFIEDEELLDKLNKMELKIDLRT